MEQRFLDRELKRIAPLYPEKLKPKCPECGSANTSNNRRVWHKDKLGKRVIVFQMRCRSCGRLFIPPEK